MWVLSSVWGAGISVCLSDCGLVKGRNHVSWRSCLLRAAPGPEGLLLRRAHGWASAGGGCGPGLVWGPAGSGVPLAPLLLAALRTEARGSRLWASWPQCPSDVTFREAVSLVRTCAGPRNMHTHVAAHRHTQYHTHMAHAHSTHTI